MLTKSEIQFLKSLRDRKARQELGLFVAEGEKLVIDLMDSGLKAKQILYTTRYKGKLSRHENAKEIREADMERITAFKTASPLCAVFTIPTHGASENFIPRDEWMLVLDGISDPGNFGTLLRTAEWFGIRIVVCSTNCVDAFNPKSVQASMGSVGRLKVYYTDLLAFLQRMPEEVPIWGATMVGQSIYETIAPPAGLLVLGSEGKGLRPEVKTKIKTWISIPRNQTNNRPESLNVAVAGSILISELCKQQKTR